MKTKLTLMDFVKMGNKSGILRCLARGESLERYWDEDFHYQGSTDKNMYITKNLFVVKAIELGYDDIILLLQQRGAVVTIWELDHFMD